jgi:hypothetical protein
MKSVKINALTAVQIQLTAINVGEFVIFRKPQGLYYKTFYGRNLRIFANKLVFVPGEPFQPTQVKHISGALL